MAALAGRDTVVKYSTDNMTYNTVAGGRAASLTINAEPIDITDKDDSGIRQLLDDVGTHSITMTFEGVLIDDTIIDLADAPGTGTALHYFEFEIGSIGDFTGQWFITTLEVNGEDGSNATMTSFTLESAGTITYT